MTIAEDIVLNNDDLIVLAGDDARAAIEVLKPLIDRPDWLRLDRSDRLYGVRRWPYLDEIPKMMVGHALGRDWYVEC